MRRVTLTKAEKRMWPILEVQVRQVRKDGSKIRGSSKWVSYCQREIRRMLPKRVRAHFGLIACALVCLLATGCATLDRTIGAAEKIAHAGADTISILRGPVEDVNKVWEATLGGDVDGKPVSEPISGVTK